MSKKEVNPIQKKKNKLADLLNLGGNVLIFFSLIFLFLTFGPAAKQEVEYQGRRVLNIEYSAEDDSQSQGPAKTLSPPNKDFSIVIPKITAVAPVVANVDPQDPDKFLVALRRGVAHAAGTPMPGKTGNVYIFAHSTDAFYNVGSYNAVFYLLGKLVEGDEIYLYYKGNRLTYRVTDKKVVISEDVKYLGRLTEGKTLTLQTCYPPGTTLKRLVVIAEQID